MTRGQELLLGGHSEGGAGVFGLRQGFMLEVARRGRHFRAAVGELGRVEDGGFRAPPSLASYHSSGRLSHASVPVLLYTSDFGLGSLRVGASRHP